MSGDTNVSLTSGYTGHMWHNDIRDSDIGISDVIGDFGDVMSDIDDNNTQHDYLFGV